MNVPPRDVFAAECRRAIEAHDDWDAPHEFMTLHWDGERLTPGTVACIMTDVHPAAYPDYMASLARKQHEAHPGKPACAYLLQIEVFGVTAPSLGASTEEQMQFQADRLGRTFHQRPDATESAIAWCADIHGRLWSAAKVRGRGGIQESFYPAGKAPGGQLIDGLLRVARATGMLAYGLN